MHRACDKNMIDLSIGALVIVLNGSISVTLPKNA